MFHLYFREYTMTRHGWLNVIEVLMGGLLWFLYGTLGVNTGSEQFLYDCASAFTVNGCIFLVSSIVNLQSAVVLPKLFYYALFHLLAAVCYIVGGVGSLSTSTGLDGVTAIVCGGFHLVHCIYAKLKS